MNAVPVALWLQVFEGMWVPQYHFKLELAHVGHLL